jgi:hypothetical protein
MAADSQELDTNGKNPTWGVAADDIGADGDKYYY